MSEVDLQRQAPRSRLVSCFFWLGLALLCEWSWSARADDQVAFSSSDPVPSAVRLPWTRGDLWFQRHWLLLGPVITPRERGQPPEVDPAAEPVAGQAVQLRGPAENVRLNWIPSTTWSDSLDLSGNLGPAQAGKVGGAPAGAAGYASTVITVDRAGPWDLSLGLDGSFELWVNGAAVAAPAGPFEFQRESTRVRVALKAGENRVLLRLSCDRKPWNLALRVLAPGAVVSDGDEILPKVLPDAKAKTLAVRTDLVLDPKSAPVQVDVLAPGGRSVAQAQARRGDVVTFPTETWAEGAYEIRCQTKTAWGEPFIAYLPWYYGDLRSAVLRLDAAAEKAEPGIPRATLQMLADMVHDRLSKESDRAGPEAALAVHAPLLEFQELENLSSGGAGPVRGGGFVRLAYLDPVDGTVQYCRAYLPADYDPGRRWPLVINLHGYNPPNPPYSGWWGVDQRHSSIADRHGVILLEPHGRGNAQYLGLGEQDVLRALSAAKARFQVDDDRVYLTGESMGGHGTWSIASRHPDIFAAAAPVYGGWDFRVIHARGQTVPIAPPARTPRESYLQEVGSSFAGAENLLHLPLYVQHGDSDQSVDVENSRHIVSMLQRWGYPVRYREHVGRGHEDLGVREEIVAWLLTHRRVSAPREVRLRALDLGSAAQYWLRIDAFDQPSQLIVAEAELIRPSMLRLDTANALTVSLHLPPELQPADGGLTVVWNGQPHDVVLKEGRVTLTQSQDVEHGLTKRAGLEGPLSDLIRTPFLVVVGTTSSDPAMRDRCVQKGEAFRQLWMQWQHESPRVKKDREVTPADKKQYSLLLIGGADANLVTSQLGERFPLRIKGEDVTIDGQTWSAKDGYAQVIYPSPFHPDRSVEVVAGTSAAGLFFWLPQLWNIPFGSPNNSWDWVIQDGRRVLLAPGVQPEDGWIASGVFDAHWRRAERWTTLGNAELRARSHLRSGPGADGQAPASLLAAVAGRYQVFPNLVATVELRQKQLFLNLPGLPETELRYGGDTTFIDDTITEAVFQPGPDGKVDNVKFYREGQEYAAQRVP